MLAKVITGCLATALLMGGTALAQSPSSKSNADQNAMNNRATQNQTLPQQIQKKLQQQGFSDVKIVPGSFLVSAKDKDGDPVNMVIGPHSMTMFTVVSSEGSKPEKGSTTSGQR
jgi:hypothetical protein